MALGPDLTPGDPGAYRPGTQRGVDGFYRVAQLVTGQWWLLDPDGRPFFAKAVHGVTAPGADPDPARSERDPAVRLRDWGFNAVGVGGDNACRDDGLPFLADANFCGSSVVIAAPGVRLPDVFDPDWAHRAALHAIAACGPLATTRELIGWVSDAALAWGATAGDTPSLLQVCLSLEPAFPAYHAAWEFVLALHGGRLEAVARAWGVALANKEVVREMTRSESAIKSRGYARDDARWTREFARRYFAGVSAAIRGADMNHLVFGCRLAGSIPAAVAVEATYPAIDVAMLPWSELPPAGATTGPVIADAVAWAEEAFWALPADSAGRVRRAARLTSVERMLRRARTALKRLARHPGVVGYTWDRWRDEPGEQPPFARGLVHVNGAEAREHTELLVEFNARADTLRRGAAKLLSP